MYNYVQMCRCANFSFKYYMFIPDFLSAYLHIKKHLHIVLPQYLLNILRA